MTTQLVINGRSQFISDDVIDFKRVASLACFHPEFIERMKYFHQDGRSGSMGPADRLRVSTGMRFVVI